jgi:hypothetical protein
MIKSSDIILGKTRTTDLRPFDGRAHGRAVALVHRPRGVMDHDSTGESPEHSPREIAARAVLKVLTEAIISRGSFLHSRVERSVVRGKRQGTEVLHLEIGLSMNLMARGEIQ